VYGELGNLIFKPRASGIPSGTQEGQARILELISPAGFEWYFEE
jgi:hypothetical protein